jgi:hypothetical protein
MIRQRGTESTQAVVPLTVGHAELARLAAYGCGVAIGVPFWAVSVITSDCIEGDTY